MIFHLLFWSILCLFPHAVSAACPSTSAELATVIDRTLDAYQAHEVDLVARLEERVRYLLDCLGEPIDPDVAASYYRIEGLFAFLGRDTEQAISFFQYAQLIDSTFSFSEDLVPFGHPIRKYYDEARGRPPFGVVQVDLPRGMKMYIDGRHTAMRPTERAVIMQLLTNGDNVEWSGLLRANSDLPFAILDHRKRHTARSFFLFAGGTGVVSVGFWTAAILSSMRMQSFAESIRENGDDDTGWTTSTEAMAGFNQANMFGWAAQVSTGISGCLALSGLVVLKW